MNIYCDESGGVGRGVMTLAAIAIDETDAEAVMGRFRAATGLVGELKGSRIDLIERALLFDLLADVPFHAAVSIAISVVTPEMGEDRGDHDIAVYLALLEDAITRLLPGSGGCAQIFIDDGRYGPNIQASVRAQISAMLGPFGEAQLQLSHMVTGIQFADVIANSFFNRALVSDRQARIAAIVAPLLETGRISMNVIARSDIGTP
jgi:Protein of unknown function (DUF3800)